jgi:hypothetical protein
MSRTDTFMFAGKGSDVEPVGQPHAHPAIDAERVRLSRHEASHSIIAVLLGWRIKLAKIGAHGGGLVDVWPDCTVARYRNPAVAPLLMFLMADAEAFSGGDYDGPSLPVPLPPGGLRVVADIIAVLLAGFASEVDPSISYRQALAVEGSDARQIEVLVTKYPAAASVRDNLINWLPAFITDELAEPVAAIAAALLRPSEDARASSLGTEDVHRVLAELDPQQMAWAARRLDVQLDALVFLAGQHRAA